MRAAAVLLAIAGCSYSPKAATSDGPIVSDGPESDGFVGSIDVAHIGAGEEAKLTGSGPWRINADTTINTMTGEVDPPLPEGVVSITSAVQQDGGPEVMVIQATTIEIDKPLAVIGSRPLILVATVQLTLDDETIDVSAVKARPGPGGFASDLGPGAGRIGTRIGTADGGSGGGSYAGRGGSGGAGAVMGALGGSSGVSYGDPNVLQGGSGGAAASSGDPGCVSPGGGGGGALQLTAPLIVGISNATINAGGGGGKGGVTCVDDGPAGAGGGSGGMIFLDAQMLTGDLRLIALGAGGGEGASADGSNDGEDGGDAGVVSGDGGNNSPGGDGGRGAGGVPAEPGEASGEGVMNGNGGGGGGSAGRIYFRHALSNPFSATPPAEPG